MKHVSAMAILVVGLLSLAPTIRAQELADAPRDAGGRVSQAPGPCSAWTVRAMRGTYAFTATAWQNLAEINPALPSGYAPVTIIGAFGVNGNGDVTGSAFINAAGLRLSAEFVNSQFGAPRADCTFPVSLSMKIGELGARHRSCHVHWAEDRGGNLSAILAERRAHAPPTGIAVARSPAV